MADEYPRDEFDQIAESAGPVGVHRAPRPWWVLLVTPLIAFLLAGLLAYGVAQVLWDSGDRSTEGTPTPAVTASVTPTAEPSAEPSPEATASETPEPEPEPSETEPPPPVIQYDAAVAVLNGTGISGLAASQQAILEEAGFTAVSAANLAGAARDVNSVIYEDPALADTAQAVADALGLGDAVQGAPTSDAAVEVQIVTDPR